MLRNWLLRRARRRQLLRNEEQLFDLLRRVADCSTIDLSVMLRMQISETQSLQWIATRVIWPLLDHKGNGPR